MLRRQSPLHTAGMTTGELENGASAASGANVNGAVRNGVNTSGASIKNGAGIETTPEVPTFQKSNQRVPLNES
jgi:hypothetical protein